MKGLTGQENEAALVVARPSIEVLEVWLPFLGEVRGSVRTKSVEDAFVGAIGTLTEDYPLDALASTFPGEPPVAVLVDARRSGGETTAVIARRLAGALVEMGSTEDNVQILDARDEDLQAGGYTVTREGPGPRCFGTEPMPGYGEPKTIEGSRARMRLSRVIEGDGFRLAVVARLRSGSRRMEPFVIDATLRAVDPETRAKALSDPVFGARVLSSPAIGERIGLVVGDLIEVGMGDEPAKPTSGERDATSADAGASVWRANELLVGTDLFAVERIGHTLLTEARRARGLSPLPEHPILKAAAALGNAGARLTGVNWKKVRL